MKKLYRQFLKPLFFSKRTYWVLTAIAVLFVISFAVPWLFAVAQGLLLLFLILTISDFVFLYNNKNPFLARRILPERFSNGDENPVAVLVEHHYRFSINLEIIDELPVQFQIRSRQ